MCKSTFPENHDFNYVWLCGVAGCSLPRSFFCCFPLFLLIRFWMLAIRLVSVGYSLTNERKAAFFESFELFWKFFGHFSLSSTKWQNIIKSLFQGLQFNQISSFKDYFEPFLMRGLLRINFWLSALHQCLQCTSLFQQYFIISLAHNRNLSFPLVVIYKR